MDISYRLGTPEDSPAVFDVFIQSIADLSRRTGTPDANLLMDPAFVATYRDVCQPLFDYLAASAEQYWVAERESGVVGYARSILEDGVRELTDFFVLPDSQSAGIGRTLIARAFPAEGARRKVIMGTTDIRAQALYLRSGVYPRFAINSLSRKPDPVRIQSDLVFRPVTSSPDTLAALRAVDKTVLGFERDAKHEVFLRVRKA
jgi:GNAT superfamily N-acetyltransferase